MRSLTLQCHACRHFEWTWLDSDRCPAFPDGIPDEIWLGEVDHATAVPGDGGVMREPREDGEINPRDARHHAFWSRAVQRFGHEEDPLGKLVLESETSGPSSRGPAPDVLRTAWRTTRDMPAMLLVLLRAKRIAELARALELTSKQLEVEGCDFLDDKGWLGVTLGLASFHTESSLANRETAWSALSAPFGHEYLGARVQQTLLRSMRRTVPDAPSAVEWSAGVGDLEDALALRYAARQATRIEDIELLAPWTTVSNTSNVENELARELVPGHRLFGRKLRAVARRSDCDDVLFVDDEIVAVVHLTWAKEVTPDFPSADIYPSPEDWAARGMQIDHQDFTGAEPRLFALSFKSELTIAQMIDRLPDKERWDWSLKDSSWYGDYVWAKHNATRVRIFAEDEPGTFTLQADLVDVHDREGWFALTRAVATKSFLPAIDATDVQGCMPKHD